MDVTDRGAETLRLRVAGGSDVELTFVDRGTELYLVATDPSAQWAHEALRSRVQVTFADGRSEWRSAELLADPAQVGEVLSWFRRKYGEASWHRYFQGRTRVVVLRETGDEIERTTADVIRGEFDAVAAGYTNAVEQNPFGRYLRRRSTSRFLPLFSGRDPILELGPGTGIETIELLRAGHRVLAVDISPRMLDQLRRRVDTEGLGSLLDTRMGAIGDLDTVLRDVPSGSIGGVLSTFGALNLEPHLERLPPALGRLLAPGAPFFGGVLNRIGITTVLYLLLAGHPGAAVRRLKNPIPVGGLLYPLEVRPFTVRQFAREFRSAFRVEKWEAASILVPPYWSPALHDYWAEGTRGRFARLDDRLSRSTVFRELGEYLFITLRRV